MLRITLCDGKTGTEHPIYVSYVLSDADNDGELGFSPSRQNFE